MLMPANKLTVDTYHLTNSSYRILLLIASALPTALTWFAGFYGLVQINKFSSLVKDSQEGPAYQRFSNGVRWIALYLPISSLVSVAVYAVANGHPELRRLAHYISTYVAIFIAVMAFSIISTGARQIADMNKVRPGVLQTRLVSLIFMIIGVVYSVILTRQYYIGISTYQLPLILLVFTIIVPYLYAWLQGMLAILDITAYGEQVKGLLYRKSMRLLAVGILLIIISSILIQYLNSINTQPGRLLFGSMLLIRYCLYACSAGGFILIAQSAKKLQQIEKI